MSILKNSLKQRSQCAGQNLKAQLFFKGLVVIRHENGAFRNSQFTLEEIENAGFALPCGQKHFNTGLFNNDVNPIIMRFPYRSFPQTHFEMTVIVGFLNSSGVTRVDGNHLM